MTNKPKLDTFVDRLSAVMLNAGVEREQLKATICAICDIQSVDDWFSGFTQIPPAENVAALSVYFKSDCVWLITGKYSSVEVVCDRHNDEVYSCNLANQRMTAKDVKIIKDHMESKDVKIIKDYED